MKRGRDTDHNSQNGNNNGRDTDHNHQNGDNNGRDIDNHQSSTRPGPFLVISRATSASGTASTEFTIFVWD